MYLIIDYKKTSLQIAVIYSKCCVSITVTLERLLLK